MPSALLRLLSTPRPPLPLLMCPAASLRASYLEYVGRSSLTPLTL